MGVLRMRPFLRSLVVLCTGAIALLVPGLAWAPQFIAGPSVRVTPNKQVEFKWTTDVSWYGKVEVFADPEGTGGALVTKEDLDGGLNRIAASVHTIPVPVGPVLATDTTYYVRATTSDPSDLNGDFANPIPVPFFTGTQALSNVQVTPGTTSADISWQGDVIGYGKVEYGTSTSYDHTSTDTANTAGHSFTLTGLDPGTTYYYRLSNVHAIDGDSLASITGSFVTVSTAITGQFLQPLDQSSDPASPILNTGKNGKVISVKVRLTQGGTPLTSQNAPAPAREASHRR